MTQEGGCLADQPQAPGSALASLREVRCEEVCLEFLSPGSSVGEAEASGEEETLLGLGTWQGRHSIGARATWGPHAPPQAPQSPLTCSLIHHAAGPVECAPSAPALSRLGGRGASAATLTKYRRLIFH